MEGDLWFSPPLNFCPTERLPCTSLKPLTSLDLYNLCRSSFVLGIGSFVNFIRSQFSQTIVKGLVRAARRF